ncbi:uncharacterized protein MYCFIDRAFT_137116 [Pseudocercospora fijiensis CIRAD86]|uniref:Radical SAM core domain-containing protein n=1 Tax=Pseudocercospora fijiensis (strain CIRAD86) TaxID=383855 RepID=M3AEH0_PSEFD|nr:uncharacterized protein MYCFIDRAFT_137116 [Pseudocercospora fijiensis CIRAD86]EME82991.1 hypothetical protein MYCFIDRAFT_137116 [Pseudocercospora fijiensis CIRAD86]
MGCNNSLRALASWSRTPTVASLPYVQSCQRPTRNFATEAGIVNRVSGSAFITPDLYNPKPNPLATATRAQGPAYWRQIGVWKDVTEEQFLSYRWQANKLLRFLEHVLPEHIPHPRTSAWAKIKTRDDFLTDVEAGMKAAPMSVRLTPHMLSVANWNDPLSDPIRRQFIPLGSTITPDHPALTLDSLHETDDSPVPGLVHRYPDKVLFLATSVCPVYCRFCTRSYAVGNNTESVTKASQKPGRKRWETMFEYIERNPAVQDVVVSGGDSYYLQPAQLRLVGERLLSVPHVQRIRFATKGLGVCPMRILDGGDEWSDAFVELSNQGRAMGKQVAMHTHINHPREITWVTEKAARALFQKGVMVRNQSVLLKGVNDDVATMSTLIRKLADLNVQPYYVYQSDMVRGVEDLRTPLSKILELERKIRGTIAGFMMPQFVVDLPGGGGKRLANSFEKYDEESGVSTWKAPGVAGDEVFTYHDPVSAKDDS